MHRVSLLMTTDREYVQRHEYGNPVKNKIKVKGIYNNKGCAQGKTGQNPNVLISPIAPFCLQC